MRQPLQHSGESAYQRPGDPWVCGLSCEGSACPFGPTSAGQCPTLPECIPVTEGRGWRCNRSDLRGGPCPEGPDAEGKCCRVHHCTPMRSLRSKRKRFIIGATMFVAGVLAIVLTSDWRSEAIVPGPLTRHHAQLVGNQTNRCDACHVAAGESLGEWVVAATWGRSNALDQTALCMKCHTELAPDDLARLAHNLPADHLAMLTREQGGIELSHAAMRELACAVCHQEHHGADHNLSALTDAQCQTCHQQQFASFAKDHPDFGAWPYVRPERIAFDHVSHSAKHFPAEKAAFKCQQCHVSDATGDVKLLVHFDQACASCHQKQIDASMAEGIAVLALPTIDIEAIQAAGHNVGPWPEWATGDFDGKLPAVMQVLLAADPVASLAMETLGDGFTFADVDPDDPTHVVAAADIARSTKQLLEAISKEGHAALSKRLPKGSAEELSALAGQLPLDTAIVALDNWFNKPQTTPGETTAADLAKLASGGGWFRDDRSMTIRYQPTGHADPWLQAWLDAAVRMENPQLRAALLADLGRTNSAGTCLSCHQLQDGGRSIAWRGFDRRDELRTFTKFSHRPHVLQPELSDCSHCHTLNLPEKSTAIVAVSSPIKPHDFLPIGKHSCVSCHTAAAAGDSCVQCHHYHVEFWPNNLRQSAASAERKQNTSRRQADRAIRLGERDKLKTLVLTPGKTQGLLYQH